MPKTTTKPKNDSITKIYLGQELDFSGVLAMCTAVEESISKEEKSSKCTEQEIADGAFSPADFIWSCELNIIDRYGVLIATRNKNGLWEILK